jgi:hypothetical protein
MTEGGRWFVRAMALGLVAVLALGVSACGSKKKAAAAPDPVAMALQTPGVRTVVIPKQRNGDLTIAVPPCSAAQVDQENTEVPPGSNEVVIPKESLAQTVAIQPCLQPSGQGSQSGGTVFITPGGATGGQGGQQQQQLVLPNDSKLKTVIVPPCTTGQSQSPQSSSSGNSVALPSTGDQESVTAPPCTVPPGAMSSG